MADTDVTIGEFKERLQRLEQLAEQRAERRKAKQRACSRMQRLTEDVEAMATETERQYRMVRMLARSQGIEVPEPPSRNGHSTNSTWDPFAY